MFLLFVAVVLVILYYLIFMNNKENLLSRGQKKPIVNKSQYELPRRNRIRPRN